MPFLKVLDHQRLAMLRRVLNEFCTEEQVADEKARENIARQLIGLYQLGVECPERLAQAIRSAPARLPVA